MEKSNVYTQPVCTIKPRRYFEIVRPAFKRSYHIVPEGEEPLYKVINTLRCGNGARKIPDLALHDGPEDTASVLAICHMPKFTKHFKIGFGDLTAPESIIWEDFLKTRACSSERKFAVTLDDDYTFHKDGLGFRSEFHWKQTRRVAVDGIKLIKACAKNWKLVDDKGNIFAVFTAKRKIGVAGCLQINVDFGKQFDVMIIITGLAMYERMRRM